MTYLKNALLLAALSLTVAACAIPQGSPSRGIESPDGSDGSFDNDTDWAALPTAAISAS